MKIESLRLSLVFALRRFPRVHRFLVALKRGTADFWFGFLRKVIPAGFISGPPKGFFSDYELLRERKLEGRVLMESQDVPPAPLDSLRKKCGFNQDLNQPWPIFWTVHSQARLIARSLVLLDAQKRISLEGAFGTICCNMDPAYRNVFLPPPTRLAGNWTSIISGLLTGYYHWFLDGLSRLALLQEFPSDPRILVPYNLAPYQLQTIQWLGLEERIRPTDEKHLLIDRYFFSAPSSMTGCYNPFAVDFLRQALLQRADTSYDPPPRFYLRRVGKYRSIINDDEVVNFFQKKGWSIIDTEHLSLARQIRLFSCAEMICAPHGAGLTNLLWASPGCKVLELCSSTFLNGVYEGLAQYLALPHRYLIFQGDNTFQSRVDLKEVHRALDF